MAVGEGSVVWARRLYGSYSILLGRECDVVRSRGLCTDKGRPTDSCCLFFINVGGLES